MSSRFLSALFLAAFLACAGRATAATFTVTNANDSGTNSLRWAIGQANSIAGADTIAFNIPGGGVHTIALASALPDIITTVAIDGTTQPGYAGTPLIELNGAGAGAGVSGLTLTQTNNLIKGLAINRFATHGIFINGGSGNHTVTQCHIGTNAAGTAALANGHSGVWINASPNIDIGPGNVIAGNAVDGVRLDQAAAISNVIKGNKIGTNLAGNAAVPNGFNGIVLTNNVTGTVIGGTTAADLNVISGNAKNGIAMSTGATATLMERNFIGLAADGATALGNLLDGVLIIDTAGNTIGGNAAGTFNIISANGSDGIELRGDGTVNTVIQRNIIGLDLFGTLDRGNAQYGVRLDGADSTQVGGGPWGAGGNLISGNGNAGVYLVNDAAAALIQGNRIGTDFNGTVAVPNGGDGVRSDGGRAIVVGNVAAPNLISGNTGSGIDIANEPQSVTIVGNRIGTDAAGGVALPNHSRGIWVRVAGNGGIIGGADHDPWTCNRACNLVAGNTVYAIQLGSNNYDDLRVIGNFIGVNLAGTAALPNGGPGVYASSGWGTKVGGEAAGEGNLISGNVGAGVEAGASSFLGIFGNRIGTNAAGSAAIANGGGGVYIHNQKPHITIGSATHTAGACDGGCNLISGNTGDAVRVAINDNFVSSNKLIVGNFFGTALDGASCLGNSRDGVRLESDFDSGQIGGIGALDGNRIACNGGNGISQLPGNYGNGFIGNTFFGNGLLAIDNGNDGVTPNDPGDGDVWLENFPLLDAATTSGATTTVVGHLDAAPSLNYRVEFFASPSCDASGYGEGRTFLGAASMASDGNGYAAFSQVMGSTVAVGQIVTATATVVSGSAPFIDYSTSEFSACITVRPPAPTAANGGPICNRQTLVLSASPVSGASYAWSGPNGFSSTAQNPSIANAGTAASGTYSVVATVAGVASNPATTVANVNACSVSINTPAAVGEGNSGSTPQTFTVTLSPTSTQAVSVDWATADGSAVAPGDYVGGSGTLTIPANTPTATLVRNVVGDTLDEGNESYTVTLSNASAGAITQAQGTGNITDDDDAPTVSIADKSCTEGNSGSTACTFTISLSALSGRTVGGTFATASGGSAPATAGTDYTAVAGTAWSIAAGSPSTTVSVNVTGDTIDEVNETFLVNLSALSNAAASGNDVQAIGTITDDDAANGQLRMSECVADISELVANIQLTVERVNGSNGAVGVSYATANGTALAGSDYTATSGTLSWPSGDATSRTITVPLINNAAREDREDFRVNLSTPTGGASLLAPSASHVWILDGQDQVFVDGFDLVPPCN